MLLSGVISVVLLTPFILYFWNMQNSLKKKLGKIHAELGINKESKFYKYRFVILMAGWVVSMSAYYGLGRLLGEPHSFNPFGFGLTMLTINVFTQPRPTTFGENGFTPFGRLTFYAWKDIDRIEWDRDLGQVEWSYKIFLKNSKTPVKANLWRSVQPQAEELFKKFLQMEKQEEIVAL